MKENLYLSIESFYFSLRYEKKEFLNNFRNSFFYVPGAGIEPARIAPLVFETSASTNSAIRA